MKKFIFLISIIIFISYIHSKLTEEKRQELLSKLAQKISLENINVLEDKFNSRIPNNLQYNYDP